MDIRELHERGLRYFGTRVHGVGEDQWDAATPCAEWDVRALVNHNVSENLWAAELGRGRTIGDVGDAFEGDLLGDDPAGAYDRSAREASDVFSNARALDRDVHVSYGPIPGREYLEHRVMDLFVHGWDLAAATGQDAAFPDDVASVLLAAAEGQQEMIRASGVFGDEVEVGSDASAQERLLALLGRDPTAW